MTRLLMCLTICASLFTASRAHAQFFAQAVGGGCVPDSATIAAHNYETAGFGVRFSSTGTGTIRLICPFAQEMGSATLSGIRVSYSDSDGAVGAGDVKALVVYAPEGSNISTTIGTCDSKNDPGNNGNPHVWWCTIPNHTTAGDRLYWYVITLTRSSTSSSVEFLGANLLYTP